MLYAGPHSGRMRELWLSDVGQALVGDDLSEDILGREGGGREEG